MPSPHDAPPARVGGRLLAGLRPVRLVGRGGEGEVWEARDARGRRRALKIVRPDALAVDVEERSRHLLGIDHPALVRVYRAGRLTEPGWDGWGFVEMAYVDGPSLQHAPADPTVLDRLWPLAEALDLLHVGAWSDGLPLVHRDVKPANIVEARDGELVLVDPSTLRGVDADQLTRVGTPVFSAPEVVTGRIGPPADVYSFAATVVALITGARGSQLVALLDDAAALDLPDGVGLALSPAAGDRPASCRAVLEAGTELADDPTVFLPALAATEWLSDDADEADDRDLDDLDVDGAWPQPAFAGPAAAPPAPTLHLPPLPSWAGDHGLWDVEHDITDVHQPEPWQPPGSPWPWTALLVALLAVPAGVAAAGVARSLVPLVAMAVAGAHVVAHLLARRSLALAVLVPPVAWALLIGDRVRSGRLRRAWAGAALTGALGLPVAVLARSWWSGEPVPAGGRLAMAAAAVALAVVVSVAAASADGVPGALGRLVLSPLWLAGAIVVVVGAVLVSPFSRTGRRAGRTLASIVEVVRLRPRLP